MSWNEGLIGELIDAAECDHDQASAIIRQNPEILIARNQIGETALHFMVIESFEKGVKLLLEKGADPNTTDDHGDSVLSSALTIGHIGIVEALLDHKADPNALNSIGDPLLWNAIQNGNCEIIRLLVDHGVDLQINNGIETALGSAVSWGHAEIVQFFLEKGVAAHLEEDDFTSLYDRLPNDPEKHTRVREILDDWFLNHF